MEVLLIREANYDFNDGKFTAIPNEVFTTLVGDPIMVLDETKPKVIMYESKDEYIKNVFRHNIDKSKSVYVNQKGQIFCYIKQEGEVDGTTDTEKD